MKIIVDTNIVFSAILNSNSRIGKVLLNSKEHFQFFSCNYLRVEIRRHRKKLLKLTKLTDFREVSGYKKVEHSEGSTVIRRNFRVIKKI